MEEGFALRILEQEHGPAEQATHLAGQQPADIDRAIAELRRAMRERLRFNPYLVLGVASAVGVALGLRPGAALLRAAVRGGLTTALERALRRA